MGKRKNKSGKRKEKKKKSKMSKSSRAKLRRLKYIQVIEELGAELVQLQITNEKLNGDGVEGLSYTELESLVSILREGQSRVMEQLEKAQLPLYTVSQMAEFEVMGEEWVEQMEKEELARQFLLSKRRREFRRKARQLRLSSLDSPQELEHSQDHTDLVERIQLLKSEKERLVLWNQRMIGKELDGMDQTELHVFLRDIYLGLSSVWDEMMSRSTRQSNRQSNEELISQTQSSIKELSSPGKMDEMPRIRATRQSNEELISHTQSNIKELSLQSSPGKMDEMPRIRASRSNEELISQSDIEELFIPGKMDEMPIIRSTRHRATRAKLRRLKYIQVIEELGAEVVQLQITNEKLNGDGVEGLSYTELESLVSILREGQSRVMEQLEKAQCELYTVSQMAELEVMGEEWVEQVAKEEHARQFLLSKRRREFRRKARELRLSSLDSPQELEHSQDHTDLVERIELLKSEKERLVLWNQRMIGKELDGMDQNELYVFLSDVNLGLSSVWDEMMSRIRSTRQSNEELISQSSPGKI